MPKHSISCLLSCWLLSAISAFVEDFVFLVRTMSDDDELDADEFEILDAVRDTLKATCIHVLGRGNHAVLLSFRSVEGNTLAVKVAHSKSLHAKNEVVVLSALSACSKYLPAVKNVFYNVRIGQDLCTLVVMDLLGPDLFEVTGKFWFRDDEIAYCGLAMLDAVRTFHGVSDGMCHKSVKPENFCFNQLGKNRFREKRTPLLTLIDFGRACKQAQYEPPYCGWWYSWNGLLGAPQNAVDDLISVVLSIGYLLEDAHDNKEFMKKRREDISAAQKWFHYFGEDSPSEVDSQELRRQVADKVAVELVNEKTVRIEQGRIVSVWKSEGTSLPSWFFSLLREAEMCQNPDALTTRIRATLTEVVRRERSESCVRGSVEQLVGRWCRKRFRD